MGTDEEWSVLGPADTEGAVRDLLVGGNRLEEFLENQDLDISHEIAGVARFRINMFRQRGNVSLVARAIPHRIRTVEDLGLPPVISDLAEEARGIILVTGSTGSGKSTTLAAIIDHINNARASHIVTIEDPIEFVHSDVRSMVSQREVGADTGSFKLALRRVLRQDPDVILIGEMRDEETVQTAISAAETGHLVLSTIHTVDCAESINRMLDFLTGRVHDVIRDPGHADIGLAEIIAEGSYYGMQTFDQALLAHVRSGRVKVEDAIAAATSPHDFKLMLEADGALKKEASEAQVIALAS